MIPASNFSFHTGELHFVPINLPRDVDNNDDDNTDNNDDDH